MAAQEVPVSTRRSRLKTLVPKGLQGHRGLIRPETELRALQTQALGKGYEKVAEGEVGCWRLREEEPSGENSRRTNGAGFPPSAASSNEAADWVPVCSPLAGRERKRAEDRKRALLESKRPRYPKEDDKVLVEEEALLKLMTELSALSNEELANREPPQLDSEDEEGITLALADQDRDWRGMEAEERMEILQVPPSPTPSLLSCLLSYHHVAS